MADGAYAAAFGTEAFRGHDGLRAWVAALDEGFETWAIEIDEARVTSDGVLLLHNHATARSRGTQMELAIQTWQEIRDRDGLIVSVVQFDAPPPGWVEATPVG